MEQVPQTPQNTQTPQSTQSQGQQGSNPRTTRYTDGVAQYTFNGKNYNTKEEAVAARDTYKAAVNADWVSVGKDRAKYDALIESGRGLSQMSDDELGFIRDRYAKSDLSKRKEYTKSGTDAYLFSMGLPSAKEINSYRQKYIDYMGKGGIEQYPELVDKDGYATDLTNWIKQQWSLDSTSGLGGVPVTKDGKAIKYEDTLLDEQLKALGMPPSSKLNEYYVKYLNSDKDAIKYDLSQYDNLVKENEDGVLKLTDASMWIAEKWAKDTAEGVANQPVTGKGGEIKYTDSRVDQQLKANGLPPLSQIDKYYVEYEKEKKNNELRDELYRDAFEQTKNGKSVEEAIQTALKNPKYSKISEYYAERIKFPDRESDDYYETKSVGGETIRVLDDDGNPIFKEDKYRKDFEKAAEENSKRDSMPWRISKEDYYNYMSEHAKDVLYNEDVYKNAKKWDTTPAKTEAEKKQRNKDINAWNKMYNDIVSFNTYGPTMEQEEDVSNTPYYKMLDLGVPHDKLSAMYNDDGTMSIAGVMAVQDYASTMQPNARADVEMCLNGLSSQNIESYERDRQTLIDTYRITGDARFKKYYAFDSSLLDSQKDASTGSLNTKGAIYNAINNQDSSYALTSGSRTDKEKETYFVFVVGAEGENPLMKYMSADEKNTFNVLFRLDPDHAINYLNGIQSLCENRRLISDIGNVAEAAASGVQVSQQDAKNYSYNVLVSAVSNEITNSSEYTKAEKEAWDKYGYYTVDALKAELANTPQLNVSYEGTGTSDSDAQLSANDEYEKIKFVLDIKEALDTTSSVSANLMYYDKEEGKEAAKSITEKDLEGSKFGWMLLKGIYDVPNYGAVKEGKERVAYQRSKYEEFVKALTEEEKNQYYWLALNNSKEAADQYMETVFKNYDRGQAEKIKGAVSKAANKNAFYKYAATQFHTALLPYTAISSVFGSIGALLAGETPSMSQVASWNIGNIATDSVSENLPGLLSFAYGTFVSMQDSAVSAALSGVTAPFVGGAMLGGSAYSSTLFEGYERGLDPKQALTTAAFAGAFEMIFESLSIDKLLSNLEAIDMPVIKRMLIQGGVEASEEFNTEVANIIADFSINGNKSKYQQQLRDYMKEGYTEEEAGRLVKGNVAADLAMASVGGFVSGGLMTLGGSAGDIPRDFRRWKANRDTAKTSLQVQETDVTNNMSQDAVLSFHKGSQFVGRNFGNKVLNDIATAVNSGKIDQKNIDKVADALKKIDTTNDAYFYLYSVDKDGNATLKISQDEFNALATSIAAYVGDNDVDNIGIIFDMMMASKFSALERAKMTNYNDIKTGEEVENIILNIDQTSRSMDAVIRKYEKDVKDAESALELAKANEASITEELEVTEGKEKESLLNRQKDAIKAKEKAQNKLDELYDKKKDVLSQIEQANRSIRQASTSLAKHYVSVASLVGEYAPNSIYSKEDAKKITKEAKKLDKKIGRAIDKLMTAKNVSEDVRARKLDNARKAQEAYALRYDAIVSGIESGNDAVSLTDIETAIQNKTLKDQEWFKNGQNKQAQKTPQTAQQQTAVQPKAETAEQKATSPQEKETATNEQPQAEKPQEPVAQEENKEQEEQDNLQNEETEQEAENASEAVKQEDTSEQQEAENVDGWEIPKNKKLFTISKRVQEKYSEIAKRFGLEIVWGNIVDEATGTKRNGLYNINDPRKIYLNTTMLAKKSMSSEDAVARQFMAHEILHWVRSTKSYKNLFAAACEYVELRGKNVDAVLDQILENEPSYNGDIDIAREEMTALFVQEVIFGDTFGKRASKLAMNILSRPTYKNAFNSLRNYIDYVIANFGIRGQGRISAINKLMLESSMNLAKAAAERQASLETTESSSDVNTNIDVEETTESNEQQLEDLPDIDSEENITDESIEEPVQEEPVSERQVAEEPVVEEATEEVAEEPVAEETVAEKPAVEEPVAEEKTAEEPVAEEVTEEVVEEPVSEEQTVQEEATPAEQPVEETTEPIQEKAPAEQPAQETASRQEETTPVQEEAEQPAPAQEATQPVQQQKQRPTDLRGWQELFASDVPSENPEVVTKMMMTDSSGFQDDNRYLHADFSPTNIRDRLNALQLSCQHSYLSRAYNDSVQRAYNSGAWSNAGSLPSTYIGYPNGGYFMMASSNYIDSAGRHGRSSSNDQQVILDADDVSTNNSFIDNVINYGYAIGEDESRISDQTVLNRERNTLGSDIQFSDEQLSKLYQARNVVGSGNQVVIAIPFADGFEGEALQALREIYKSIPQRIRPKIGFAVGVDADYCNEHSVGVQRYGADYSKIPIIITTESEASKIANRFGSKLIDLGSVQRSDASQAEGNRYSNPNSNIENVFSNSAEDSLDDVVNIAKYKEAKGEMTQLSNRSSGENELRYSNPKDLSDILDSVPDEVKDRMDKYKKDYGIQNQNEYGEANNIETPNRIGKYKKVNKTAQRIKQAEETSDAMRNLIDVNIASDTFADEDGRRAFVHGTKSEEFFNKAAEKYVTKHNGETNAIKDLTEKLKTLNRKGISFYFGAAERLIDDLSGTDLKVEDLELVSDFLSQYAMATTEWGRQGRIMQLIRKTPIGRRMYWQKVVAKINSRYEYTKNSGLNKVINRKSTFIDVPNSFYDDIENAQTEAELKEAEENLTKYIGQHAPLTVSNMFRNWRYFAMLANPITHARNLMGNTGMLSERMTKDLIAAGLENIAVKAGMMKQSERTHSARMGLRSLDNDTKKWVKEVWAENASTIQQGGHEGFNSILRDAGKKSPVAFIDKLMDISNLSLEGGDRLFLYTTFTSALTQIINARGYDVNNITKAQKREVVEYATQQALEATYRDASRVADWLNQMAKSGAIARMAIESIMPFKKTPINILKRGIEYSPLNLLNGVYEIVRNSVVKDGERVIPAWKVCDDLAKGITGSALMMVGFLFSKLGILKQKAGNGGDDEDRDETFEKDVGHQDYSIEIGNLSIKIEQLAPLTFPLFVGAALQEATAGENDALEFGEVFDIVTAMFNPIMDMSFLAGINTTLETYRKNKLGGVVSNVITSYIGQYVPTIGSKFNKTVFNEKTTSKADATAPWGGTLDSVWRSWVGNIPIVGPLVLEPYVKTTGEIDSKGSILTKEGFFNYTLAFLDNFVLPTNITIIDSKPVNKEIARLVSETGQTSFVPENPKKYMQINNVKYEMTAKEYTEYSKEHNEAVYAAVSEIIDKKQYKNATDEQKVNMLSQAYDRAKSTVSAKYRAIFLKRMKEK